ncbi:MAG: glycosyltransferase family 39 protein [Chloroflexota bacterium]
MKKNYLTFILVFSVVSRLVVAFFFGNGVEILPGTFDQVSYHNLALRLLDGYGFSFAEPWWPLTDAGEPTAHWSFLYTFYLTAVYFIFGPNPLVARIIQVIIVGLLQPYLVYLIGRHLFDERVGLVAAGLTAVYIYFIYYAATLMTEPFYITAILAVLYLALRFGEVAPAQEYRLALLLGVVLVLTIHLRQLFLLFVPFLFLWILWRRYDLGNPLPFMPLVLMIGLVIGSILPFTYYNYQRFDQVVLLNTNAGFAFFWANHPVYGTRFHPILPPELGNYLELVPRELRDLDEAELEQALLQRGLQFIFDDPGRYIMLSLSRIPVYFTFWPTADSSLASNLARLASFGLLFPFMLYGAAKFLWQRSVWDWLRHPAFLLLLFGTVYTAVHILIWALIRYRLPVDAVMLIFAAIALLDIPVLREIVIKAE